VEGVSARIQYTNHLLEGASLAGASGQAGQLASSPLLQGASGRLWVANDGRVRLELQSAQGDTEVILDKRIVTLYDSSSNTVYRYTLPQAQQQGSSNPPDSSSENAKAPSVAEIEEAIAHLSKHAHLSGATPTDVAGQPAYTARISPNEAGSLLGGFEFSWDAAHGVPLRAAIYSSTSSAPVIELAATDVSYGPVESSVFDLIPPPGAKVVEPQRSHESGLESSSSSAGAVAPVGGGTGVVSGPVAGQANGAAPGAETQNHPNLRTVGQGVSSVLILETPAHGQGASATSKLPSGLSKVRINGTTATELPTALGTLLSFERSGVNYLLAGALRPEAVEAVARGL
jgi:outer membrane lipoprotein-sorting protein